MMETNSPYESVSSYDVLPGQLVLLDVANKITSAFAIQFKTAVGFLVLEGEQVGAVEYRDGEKVLRFKEAIYLQLPTASSGWAGANRPPGSLVVASHDDKAYFLYRKAYQEIAVDIASGAVCDVPHRCVYVHKWAIYSNPEHAPVLQSTNPA